MKTGVFSVYDSKAKSFMQPFFSVTVATAVRMLDNTVNDGQSMLSRHPEDFVLYRVAEFDDDNGLFTPAMPIEQVALAVMVRREPRVIPTKEGGHEAA